MALGDLLESAVRGLPDRQWLAFKLRAACGLSVSEAADFMGVDPVALNQLLFRARRNLRRKLARFEL